jgi:hypothetical protein
MSDKPTATMKYVRLGKTGLKVSKVSEILPSPELMGSSRMYVIWFGHLGGLGFE